MHKMSELRDKVSASRPIAHMYRALCIYLFYFKVIAWPKAFEYNYQHFAYRFPWLCVNANRNEHCSARGEHLKSKYLYRYDSCRDSTN